MIFDMKATYRGHRNWFKLLHSRITFPVPTEHTHTHVLVRPISTHPVCHIRQLLPPTTLTANALSQTVFALNRRPQKHTSTKCLVCGFFNILFHIDPRFLARGML